MELSAEQFLREKLESEISSFGDDIITGITDRIISSRWYKQPIDEPDYECSINEIKSIPLNEEILLKCKITNYSDYKNIYQSSLNG
jgi:hypothetical protein